MNKYVITASHKMPLRVSAESRLDAINWAGLTVWTEEEYKQARDRALGDFRKGGVRFADDCEMTTTILQKWLVELDKLLEAEAAGDCNLCDRAFSLLRTFRANVQYPFELTESDIRNA